MIEKDLLALTLSAENANSPGNHPFPSDERRLAFTVLAHKAKGV